MKTHALLIPLFLTLSLPCFARVGETIDQSIQRYGPQYKAGDLAPDCKMLVFETGKYEVSAGFYQGKCVVLLISKLPKPSIMSEEEVDAVLAQNSDGNTWGKPVAISEDDGGVANTCKRSDGVEAFWKEYGHNITFFGEGSKTYQAAVDLAERQKKAAAAKQGASGL